jgi:hypothetical protein
MAQKYRTILERFGKKRAKSFFEALLPEERNSFMPLFAINNFNTLHGIHKKIPDNFQQVRDFPH